MPIKVTLEFDDIKSLVAFFAADPAVSTVQLAKTRAVVEAAAVKEVPPAAAPP